MLFARIVSFFAFTVTLGGLALATPVVEKPDLATVRNVVATLKASSDSILPELKNIAANKNATNDAVSPLLNQLIGEVNKAHASLIRIPVHPAALEKRQDLTDIATLIAELVTEISTVLEALLGSSAAIPILGSLIPALDAALTALLTGLDALVVGLLTTVGALLATVATLLEGVGLGLLLGLLGL